VLTLDAAAGDLDRGDVLIDGGRIAAIAPRLEVPDAEVVDAAGMAPRFR